MSSRPHGYARYRLDGCRCYTCGWAVAQYNDAREHAMRRGEWQPWTDAQPVREHVRRLQACAMGLRAIAAAAHVDRKRLQSILGGRPERGTGPQEKVRPALAAAVLAVEPTLDNLAATTVIGATGTTRRLQALVAGGWPQEHLGHKIGVSPGNFSRLVEAPTVIVRTVRAVRGLYEECWRADPLEHGASQGGITYAKRRAAQAGWAPVGAWDDESIDDPAAFPDWTGRCGTEQGYEVHRRLRIMPACRPCLDARAQQKRERAHARAGHPASPPPRPGAAHAHQ
ncbi:hypothetical protein ACFY3G_02870 [Streptomyces phaeochromogenes]|uniref:hypothetical protein n=1 Tax=Streptomyces phaeochromogenes TaxID=1923 RepID=UPI0036CCFF23